MLIFYSLPQNNCPLYTVSAGRTDVRTHSIDTGQMFTHVLRLFVRCVEFLHILVEIIYTVICNSRYVIRGKITPLYQCLEWLCLEHLQHLWCSDKDGPGLIWEKIELLCLSSSRRSGFSSCRDLQRQTSTFMLFTIFVCCDSKLTLATLALKTKNYVEFWKHWIHLTWLKLLKEKSGDHHSLQRLHPLGTMNFCVFVEILSVWTQLWCMRDT